MIIWNLNDDDFPGDDTDLDDYDHISSNENSDQENA